MEKKTTLVDEHLQAMQGMSEAGTDDFFYGRLKARMEREHSQQGWTLPLRPVWVVSTLALLLVINGFMLSQQFKKKSTNAAASNNSPLQDFASAYDQNISSY